jgi:hypothetical protein
VQTARPSVSGTAAVGRRLTGLTGTWAGSGAISYRLQWYRCNELGRACTAIRGATSAGYQLVGRDAGKTIGLTVSATDATGATERAYASLVGPIAPSTPLLVATAQPTLTGTPIQGKSLQVTTGAWSPTPTAVTYAWLRCNRNGRLCDAIANATANSYVVSPLDIGHALVAAVRASFGTSSQSAFSTASAIAVGAEVVGPIRAAGPSVGGVAASGRELTASAGTWSGLGPISYAYTWYRCDARGAHCNRVRGATKATYMLGARDAGRTLGLRVDATDSTGTAVAHASLVGPVAPSAVLIATTPPVTSGDAKVGRSLIVSSGTWSPTPTSYSYAWHRCNPNGRVCTPIAGATASSYLVSAADSGHAVVALVTATFRSSTQSAFGNAVVIP